MLSVVRESKLNNTEDNSLARHHHEAGSTRAAAGQRHFLGLRQVLTEVSHTLHWTQADQTCPPVD